MMKVIKMSAQRKKIISGIYTALTSIQNNTDDVLIDSDDKELGIVFGFLQECSNNLKGRF